MWAEAGSFRRSLKKRMGSTTEAAQLTGPVRLPMAGMSGCLLEME